MKPSRIQLPNGQIVGDTYAPHGDSAELDVAWTGSIPRVLGCLPPRPGYGGLPKYSEANEVIPRADWIEQTYAGYPVPILNQGETGSCVGHGAVEAFWRQWDIQNLPVPTSGFSSCWVYSLINGGRDSGAVISDAMDVMIEHGVATLDQVPEGMIFYNRIPSLATVQATAMRYKLKEAYHCETFDDIGSALTKGLMVVFAIRAGGNWSVDPSNGIVQFVRGPGNHAQHGRGLKKIGGNWYVDAQNSWGETWGINGCYYAGERHLSEAGQDAFAIQFANPDPQNPHLPPKAE